MPTLPHDRIATLLGPYLGSFAPPPTLISALSTYLDLLLKWNARTNLTAIRDPEEIVQRHFGESLFTGLRLTSHVSRETVETQGNESDAAPSTVYPLLSNLLDFGSGAGFPGLPIQLLLPHLPLTLAESQNKKSTFLREVVRTLNLPTEVWAARVETLPSTRLFSVVTLRAVDNMAAALAAATTRLPPGGYLAILSTEHLPNATNLPLPHPSSGYLALTQPTLLGTI